MSAAASQYARFKEEVVRTKRVFTFKDDGHYLVFRVREADVIPFWSSRSRLIKIQKEHAKYKAFEISEIPLDEFPRWLPKVQKDRIHVGANWSGPRMTGYDVEAKDVIAGLRFWIDKVSAGPSSPPSASEGSRGGGAPRD